ncbi:MAG: chromate transporter [Candidatus Pristimantibacillus lignocellulolyticus]|uniref:Chromate transporter n=1 Tax=Candidatus Pristimantibacillus lignocellulolyticus TaxID=2994561 RepID=A0A9J6ZED1_9BACL|nr:MAG: chromate transporter [Candidatus Pristimantibacillus lignocellulolyticus]
MSELIQLFIIFFMIGCVSFGGGYSMIPLMQTEIVNRYQWLTMDQFSDVVAVAGMSPGPIATNMAISIGYMHLQLPGAIVATIGMVLPSLLCIILLAVFYNVVSKNEIWANALYGIRAAVTGFIFYSAIIFTKNNGVFSSDVSYTLSQIFIFIGSLVALMYFKKHPIYVIVVSGLVGVALYS